MSNNSGNFGLSLFGLDPFGSAPAAFGVAGATSYSPHFVQVRFTDLIDLTDALYTDPNNYVITPTLGVYTVIIESADSVVLATDGQSAVLYTVTVGSARSFFNVPMVPPNDTATFAGSPGALGSYFAVGTSPTRVRCIFSTQMQLNAALTDPPNYTVTDLNGTPLPVLSVEPEQSGNPLSVVLTLGTEMQTTVWYQTILSPSLVDIHGQSPKPSAVDFQWVLPTQNVAVPISEFTGEVSGGPFGNPDGLVFFSPSLNVAASNSTIQVEEVAVCTTAYDQYHFPQPLDPAPFYVWSQSGPLTTLGETGIVLFGGFPFLSEASFNLGFTGTHLLDPMPEAFDGSCSVVLKATYAPSTLIALLNELTYTLYAGLTTATPPTFVCADNSMTPTPGTETIIVLRQAIVGNSTMTVAEPDVVHWATASIVADSTFATVSEATARLAANSIMRVARPSQNIAASSAMMASSHMQSGPIPSPQALLVTATIAADSQMAARVPQNYAVSVAMAGEAEMGAQPWLGLEYVEILADSTMGATATVDHAVSAVISGSSFVAVTVM